MSQSLLKRLIEAQGALINALDSRDADRIEEATRALDQTLVEMRSRDSWQETADTRESVTHALNQTTAARIRVNYLADWTRQRIDRLSELRGNVPPQTYGRGANQLRKQVYR